MTMAHEAVTHPPPPIPRGADPAHVLSRAEITNLIDERINAYDRNRREVDAEKSKQTMKERVITYAVGGVGGLAVGIGGTLLIQKWRGKPGPTPMK